MTSRSRFGLVAVVLVLLLASLAGFAAWRAQAPAAEPASVLRVCADPNNLPFSDRRGAGFENRIAEVIAGELGARVAYTWWPQRRGFVRNTLRAGRCDVVMGVPASFEQVLPTRPYYRSSYVFVWRRDQGPAVRSLDDPVLARLKVGIPLVGDEYANAPPALALARRGLAANLVGYSVWGDYRQPSPPSAVIEAVARGEVDVAVAWGPLAGYFAPRQAVPLAMAPVSPQIDLPFLPFVFDMAMGVRREDTALRDRLDRAIEQREAEIAAILDRYGVPRVGGPGGAPARTGHATAGRAAEMRGGGEG
jgi:mxaJ protein